MDTRYQPTPQNAPASDAKIAADSELRAAIATGHETSDVSVKGLFIFAGSLLVSLVAILLGLVVVFKGYQWFDGRLDLHATRNEPGSLSRVHLSPQYDGPLLQVHPEAELHWSRAQDAAALGGYGWIDRSKGTVRLPIARAMDVLVERGVPPTSPGMTIEAIQRQRADPQVGGQALRP